MAIAWKPTKAQAIALRDFTRNGEHYLNNVDNIREKHAGNFIAICNQEVMLSLPKLDDLLAQLRTQLSESVLASVYVTYTPKEDEITLA